MKEVWVLWWRYHDGSAAGMVRAYTDEQRAHDDLDLLSEVTDRKYEIEHVPVYANT